MNYLETKLNENHYDRVRSLTQKIVREEIDAHTQRSILGAVEMGPEAIKKRLKELDKEWDIDRVIMLNFSLAVFFQLLKARENKKWLIGPLIQTPFLFLHSTLGWCPPTFIFRKMGYRTRKEIQMEREILIEALNNSEWEM